MRNIFTREKQANAGKRDWLGIVLHGKALPIMSIALVVAVTGVIGVLSYKDMLSNLAQLGEIIALLESSEQESSEDTPIFRVPVLDGVEQDVDTAISLLFRKSSKSFDEKAGAVFWSELVGSISETLIHWDEGTEADQLAIFIPFDVIDKGPFVFARLIHSVKGQGAVSPNEGHARLLRFSFEEFNRFICLQIF